MSATNTTTNLGLSQFVNTDVPAWRQDYNGDMLKIDNAYTADISGATAETSADPSDYMKFYDVSATTNKKILISDLLKGAKVEDLTDTDITTPVDDDGLVYDSTSQKWENVPIMTKEQWKKNGAYNLCGSKYTTEVDNGITFTANSDGSVTTSGSVGSGRTYSILIGSQFTLKAGTYVLSSNPVTGAGGRHTAITLINAGTSSVIKTIDTLEKDTFTLASDVTCYAQLVCYGTGESYSVTFKPMITTDLNATVADFVGHAKTNRQLTEDIKITTYTKTTDNTGECSIGSDSAYVPIGGSIVGTQNTHTGAVSFRTASSDRNSYYAMFYSATSSALNVVANKELTFIVVWVKKA